MLEQAILEAEKAQPLRFGPQKSELKSKNDSRIHPETAEAWFQAELANGALFARGDRLRRSSPELRLGPKQEALRARLLAELETRGLSGPTQKEFLEGFPGEPDASELLQLLLADETVLRLPSDILGLGTSIEALRAPLIAYFETHDDMTVANLKDVAGVSRKQGVPILEHLDRLGWTARRGDVRVRGSRLLPTPPSDSPAE